MPDPLAPLGGPGQAPPLASAPTQGPPAVPTPPLDRSGQGAAEAVLAPSLLVPRDTIKTESKTKAEAEARAEAKTKARNHVSVEEAAKAFREFLKSLPADLHYSVDEETGTVVFKVVNPLTKEVLRQYPPEELLEVARRLSQLAKGDRKTGILLDQSL